MSNSGHQTKLWYLAKINLFSAMSQKDMIYMSQITRMEETPKYSPIFLPGDPADSIYLLKSGRVRISKISSEGKQITMSILEPGNIFGELSLVDDNSPRETIAEAMEDTLLCIIRKRDFEEFLKQHPEINLQVTKLIGMRLKNIETRVEDLVFRSSRERLLSLLKKLSVEYGKKIDEGILIDLKLTHQELSELISTTRQTVAEWMKKFEKEYLIQMKGRKIILLSKFADITLD